MKMKKCFIILLHLLKEMARYMSLVSYSYDCLDNTSFNKYTHRIIL